MARHHDDRKLGINQSQATEQGAAVEPRHPQIRNDDSRKRWINRCKDGLAVTKFNDLQLLQFEHLAQCRPHIGLVINDDDRSRRRGNHAAALSMIRNSAPPLALRSVSSPPNWVMMSRQMTSPSPTPSGFELLNGSNKLA